MSKTTAKVMAAYIIGNIIQIVLAVLAKVSFMSRPIMFCVAAGFLVLFAIIGGITLADSEKQPERKKSYKDYAENIDSTE